MTFIYGLIDPFTFKVRYIGKTKKKLKERLSAHCRDVSKTHKSYWIQKILSKNRRPIIVVLKVLSDDEDWISEEIKWIKIARKYNWPLVNSTDGGDGVLNISGPGKERMLLTWKGRKHKPESIAKMSLANTGMIHTESYKDIMSEKMKGREIKWSDKLKTANRKLSDEDLIDIKNRLDNGDKVKDLSKIYGVHRTTMSKIKAGTYKTFKQKTINYIKPRRFHSKQ